MSAKRALIVDDSRSARVILSRMLETYGMQVDTAESAEQALEYLGHARPDVIFMDHLMPGMDGFQAVRAIKANPATAIIPVLMYTSQEGELYVGQARALGAVGVLPKTVKQVDVSRVLYDLHLLPDRREQRSSGVARTVVVEEQPSSEPPASAVPRVSANDPAWRQAMVKLLDDHQAEMRRFIAANFDAVSRRLSHEHKSGASAAPASESEVVTPPPQKTAPLWPWVAAIALAALLPFGWSQYLYQQTADNQHDLIAANTKLLASLAEQRQQITAIQENLEHLKRTEDASLAAVPAAPPAAARTDSESVPYGEIPLAGTRLDKFRTVVERLRGSGFKGKLRVESFVGDFCLSGNPAEGFAPAQDDLPSRRCDLVGNPFEDGLNPAQQQSVDFANYVATLRRSAGSSLQIEFNFAGRKPSVPYPTVSDRVTAGDWNRIGVRNNRVEFTPVPAG